MAEAQVFGKYLLLRKLAAGGMGEVYLAKQQGPEGFEKFLVIKRILSHHTDNPDYVDMFFAEARLAAKMSHSNIVQIYEMGEIDGAYFIAMEYVNGKSMKDIIDAARAKGQKLEPAHIAEMIAKLASGLGYAHNLSDMGGNLLNIIHRDINPHNVLVSYGGEVKIIDFGIAKSEINEHKTETGTIKGKFVYMSPEQSAAEKIDKRSDIFSIGIVLYEMLSGENPFQKANIVLSLDAIQRFTPPLPSTWDEALKPFDPIAKKVLEKKADDRYQDNADLVNDLQRMMATNEIPRATRTMQQLMQDLFKEQIEKEQRFIQDILKSSVIVPRQTRSGNTNSNFNTNTNSGTNSGAEPQPMALPPVQLTPSPSQIPSAQQTGSRTGALHRRRKKRQMVYAILAAISIVTVGAVAAMLGQHSVAGPEPTNRIIDLTPQPPPPQPQPSTPQPLHPTPPTVQTPPPTQPQPEKEKRAEKEKERERGGKDKRGREKEKEREKEKAREEEPAKGEPKVVVVPETPKAPDPPPKKAQVEVEEPAPAPKSNGYLIVNATPSAPIFRDGSRLGGGGATRVDLKNAGTISVGDGTSPFQITFQYRMTPSHQVELSIDSKPWAILKKGGISLGRTPRPWINATDGTQRFEFVSPGVEGMTVVVRYNP